MGDGRDAVSYSLIEECPHCGGPLTPRFGYFRVCYRLEPVCARSKRNRDRYSDSSEGKLVFGDRHGWHDHCAKCGSITVPLKSSDPMAAERL